MRIMYLHRAMLGLLFSGLGFVSAFGIAHADFNYPASTVCKDINGDNLIATIVMTVDAYGNIAGASGTFKLPYYYDGGCDANSLSNTACSTHLCADFSAGTISIQISNYFTGDKATYTQTLGLGCNSSNFCSDGWYFVSFSTTALNGANSNWYQVSASAIYVANCFGICYTGTPSLTTMVFASFGGSGGGGGMYHA